MYIHLSKLDFISSTSRFENEFIFNNIYGVKNKQSMFSNSLRTSTASKCIKEIDPWFLNFLRTVRDPQRRNDCYRFPKFPKYLDERTGEPKYDSYISSFVDATESTDHTP